MGSSWPWLLAVAVCMGCSFFVQSGEGAVYAIVPLVKKRVSGQVAGMAGAMGNVGAVCFLTLNILVGEQGFFLCIAVASLVAVGLLPVPRRAARATPSSGHRAVTDGPVAASRDIDLARPTPPTSRPGARGLRRLSPAVGPPHADRRLPRPPAEDLTAVERFADHHDRAAGPLRERWYRQLLPAEPPARGSSTGSRSTWTSARRASPACRPATR